MRVLIVDDEPLVRIGLKSAIRWEAGGMQIVGEAADGEEAMKLIMERKPDVVILDIKMPKKDGIAVLSEMKENGIKAKVIMLSSFDDFTLVKKAMMLGASDYFHKPGMNELEIEAALQKIKNEEESLHAAGENASNAVHDKETTLKKMLLEDLHGVQPSKIKESNVYVLMFSIKKYSQVLKRYTKDNALILPNSILNILSELLSREDEVEFVQLDENLYSVIVSHSETKSLQATFAHVNDIVYLISSSLKRFVNIDTVFGISETFQSFNGWKQATAQAKQALDRKFYHPNDPLFYFQPRKGDMEDELERINTYIAAMKNGLKEEKYDEFALNLAEWEQYLQDKECMNERDIHKIYQGLLFMMEDGEQYLENGNKLEEIEDFNELSSLYHTLFNEKLRERISQKNKEYSPLIRNILQYIETHYKENISLKSLGEHFHVSANYISRLFKQEVERGLFDYINDIRIEKAKELLKDYRYKIYEVAELVGFNSQVHFAIVFHKYVGMAPKEYRKEQV
ncbi:MULTISPECIES: response regulator [unclassified Paenibacillus]|uniref:response regulator transcription factor n=1 Tax=unclassified Paenibacillus TaxID=185978 RepID=UPI001AEB3CCE|nr:MULTISPECIES: response regulator [unclassified Paenibacillus]MBP1154121.1 two-component system response regulator YesN [Paenibacillus sp. PvP091]MBP1170494.1 two-component system response regulator YesN [Paenibacillus sp. PvR098]MBP2441522.1 two-component system response regulator YesN [Paenibacillus sp. PvP052]